MKAIMGTRTRADRRRFRYLLGLGFGKKKDLPQKSYQVPSKNMKNGEKITQTSQAISEKKCYCLLSRWQTSEILWCWLLVGSVVQLCQASTLGDFDGATFYKAPVGSRIRIACNGSHWSEDSVSLVLWFKGTIERHSVPIYTLDARQKPLHAGARHLVADAYRGRAKFVTRASPPYLDLAPLEEADQSEYRCRIDYRSRPRENFLIILFVIVPPKSVQIMDSNGRSLEQIYGPLSERTDLTLLCLSKGGRPAPSVVWKRRRKVIDDSYLTLNDFLALKQLSSRRVFQRPAGRFGQPMDHDKNQTDSINSLPPTNPSALESVWHQWRNWPEFHYYLSYFFSPDEPLNSSLVSEHELHNEPFYARSPAPTSRQQQPLWQSKDQVLSGSAPSSEPPSLLTLPVDHSITTALNVLKLADLGPLSALAYESAPSYARQRTDTLEPARPELECEASNLHYDLSALIKLFAPPSLNGPPKQHQQPQQASTSAWPTPHQAANESSLLNEEQQLSRQLAAAINEAFESALRGEQEQELERDLLVLKKQVDLSQSGNALRLIKTDPGSSTTGQLFMTHQPSGESSSVAKLVYQQLSRPHQLRTASLAQEPGLEQDIHPETNALVRSKLIALDVYLRPMDVKIVSPQRPLSAGQLAEFTCSSSGSRPSARLSWLKNGRPLESKLWRQVNEPQGNVSHSKLSLQLEQQDHGAQLVCRAHNEHLNRLLPLEPPGAGQLEDSRILTVHYPPRVRLELGTKILSSSIREGTDIYFVCHVDAMPPVKEITWLHNERPINDSVAPLDRSFIEGLIISNNSLVLQRVKLEQRGHYACMAFNNEGVTESNRIELRVLHPPICRSSSTLGKETADSVVVARKSLPLHSQTALLCQMEADPSDLELTWYLNNSYIERKLLHTVHTTSNQPEPSSGPLISVQRTPGSSVTSQLNYQVDTNLDYGRLYCVARNSIGEQKRACVYELEQSDPGELATFSCMALNITSSSVWIGCHHSPGHHKFLVQVYRSAKASPTRLQGQTSGNMSQQRLADLDSAQLQLEANLSITDLDEPFFQVSKLRPQTSYTLSIQAVDNFTGRSSQPALVALLTGKAAANEPLAVQMEPSVEPINEPHPSGLLSSLISTRSTNGSQRNSSSWMVESEPDTRQGWLDWLASLASGPSPSRVQADSPLRERQNRLRAAKQRANGGGQQNQLMDISDALLITGVSLVLLVSLIVMLLFHRRSVGGCSKWSKAERSGRCEKATKPQREATDDSSWSIDSNNDHHQVRSSHNQNSSHIQSAEPAKSLKSVEPDLGVEKIRPLKSSSSSTCLDVRSRSSFGELAGVSYGPRFKSQSLLRNSTFLLPAESLATADPGCSSLCGSTPMRLPGSSSSACFESLLMAEQHQQQQHHQQQRLIQFTDLDWPLISNSNLSAATMPSQNVQRSHAEPAPCWPYLHCQDLKQLGEELCQADQYRHQQNLTLTLQPQTDNLLCATRDCQLEYETSQLLAPLDPSERARKHRNRKLQQHLPNWSASRSKPDANRIATRQVKHRLVPSLGSSTMSSSSIKDQAVSSPPSLTNTYTPNTSNTESPLDNETCLNDQSSKLVHVASSPKTTLTSILKNSNYQANYEPDLEVCQCNGKDTG